MHCELKSEMLGTYLDGELPPEQMKEVYAHIAGCSSCAVEIAELVRLKRELRTVRNHFVPTVEFQERLRQQISVAKPKPRSKWKFLGFTPALVAFATMAILLIVVATWMTGSRSSDAMTEVADLHVGALASANPLDVVSSDKHTVKPWFQGRVPFTFNIPDFAGSDFQLLGGRMIYFRQEPGAQLIMTVRQHKISVLIFRAQQQARLRLPAFDTASRRDGFNIETWQQQGLRFIIISDADAGTLAKLSRALQKEN